VLNHQGNFGGLPNSGNPFSTTSSIFSNVFRWTPVSLLKSLSYSF
jgi:hypothetical protein